MRRRELLWAAAGAAFAANPESVLVHEHVLVDFVGADQIRPGRYDQNEVFRIARRKLEEVRRLGCGRLIECTPNFLGRDPELLARLSDATGLEIWSNTGLYGAGDHKFVPAFARSESAAQLGKRWVAETREAWRPRFIKIGVNRGPLDELDRKLVRAAAITARETGLTIACHTGDGAAEIEQLEIITAERVSPAKFVWVHAQNERDQGVHEKVARAGAWVEFDGIGPKTAEFHLECVRFLAAKGLLERTLLSQDAGWYHVGQPGGGEFRGYTYVYTDFLPRLQPTEVRVLMWENPRREYTWIFHLSEHVISTSDHSLACATITRSGTSCNTRKPHRRCSHHPSGRGHSGALNVSGKEPDGKAAGRGNIQREPVWSQSF